jgi:hypothetical protein
MDIDTRLILDFSPGTKINVISATNGQKSVHALTSKELLLTRAHLYEIPITNKELNYKDYHVIKVEGDISERIHILNVRDGMIVIEAIVHLAKLKDQMVIGKVI